MKVYIVDERTWSSSRIVKVFFDEKKANDYAAMRERDKPHSDGYQSFYVTEYEVEE